MNHLQNHIDNYLVHCQTQKRLDAKTLKAYRFTAFLKQYLSRNYRFFDQFLYLKYHLRRLFFTEKRIVFTATRAIKAMRFKSLKKQYSILNILVLNHNQHKS